MIVTGLLLLLSIYLSIALIVLIETSLGATILRVIALTAVVLRHIAGATTTTTGTATKGLTGLEGLGAGMESGGTWSERSSSLRLVVEVHLLRLAGQVVVLRSGIFLP